VRNAECLLARLAIEVIPQDPSRAEYRQGNMCVSRGIVTSDFAEA
jgi:hypothetical protein